MLFTGNSLDSNNPAAADSLQASQRLVYVSQKCSKLPPQHFHSANPRITSNSSITGPPYACSCGRRSGSKKELPASRSGRHCCPSLLLILRRGSRSGSCSGPARPVHAKRPHGTELGHQRLHHQRGSARRQRSHGILLPPLAPASQLAAASLRPTQRRGAVGAESRACDPLRGLRLPPCASVLPSGSQTSAGTAYPHFRESGNI